MQADQVIWIVVGVMAIVALWLLIRLFRMPQDDPAGISNCGYRATDKPIGRCTPNQVEKGCDSLLSAGDWGPRVGSASYRRN